MKTIENKGSERFCRKDLTLPVHRNIIIWAGIAKAGKTIRGGEI
jgi:hypothetical protein